MSKFCAVKIEWRERCIISNKEQTKFTRAVVGDLYQKPANVTI